MKFRMVVVTVLIALLVGGLIPASSAHAGSCTWHVVKKGENLTQIGRKYGVSVSSIVQANGLKNANRIYRGQSLCIPQKSKEKKTDHSTSSCTKIHIVKRGEYVKLIASRYGVSVSAITKANHLKNPNRIYVGQRLVIPVPCKKTCTTSEPADTTKPWKGQYWANRDLAGDPKFIRYQEQLSFDWGADGPVRLGAVDNFSIRWVRTMHFDGGKYLFHAKVKDGVRVLLDGQPVISEWHDAGYATNYQVEKDVSYGSHTLQVDYYNHTGPAQIHFQVEPLDVPVPPDPGAWAAEYWNNVDLEGAPVWATTHRDLVFDWSNGSPKTGIAADFFSARYVGDFFFSAGTYRFYSTVDDGVRIWVDGKLILDEWRVQWHRTFFSDVDLAEGNHQIKVEFFENMGCADLKVLWSKR